MWRLYAEYGRGNALRFVVGVVGTLLARFLGLVPPLLLGLAVDAVFLGERAYVLPLVPAEWVPATRWDQLWLSVGLVAASFLLGSAATWLQNWGWNSFAQRVQHALRVDTYRTVQELDAGFFDDRRTGELMSVLNNDVNQLESFLSDGVSSALRTVALVVGVGAVLWSMNASLAVVTMAVVPVLLAFTLGFARIVGPKYATMRASVGALNSRLETNLAGMPVIKSEHTEAYEADRVEDASRDYLDANWDAIATRIWFFPGLNLVTGLGFVLTFAVGGVWVLTGTAPGPLSGTLYPGEFVAFVLYVQQFIWPVAQFGQVVNDYQRARASAVRVFDVSRETPAVVDAPDAEPLPADAGRVEYDGVSFAYPTDRRGESEADEDSAGEDAPAPAADAEPEYTLRDVSFAVDRGETLGIVGPTGSGKSTLVKLLVRTYDPDEGTIRVDGRDVRDVSLASLRDAVGYVSQEPFLFPGTVRENIAYGRFDATDEAVEAAARAAQAHEFVRRLPDGYDTLVGERGVKLSGGQRQRVALARVVLKDAPILVLDEATSHVDTETEALIRWGLAEFAADRTTLSIAHRLSTVKDADRILVLDEGRVVEAGTHDELLALDGLYANLWRVQAGDVEDLPREFLEDALRRRGRVEEAEPTPPERFEGD